MRIDAALSGNLTEFMAAEEKGMAVAVTDGLKAVAIPARDQVRRAIANALGGKNAKSWKVKLFPKSGQSTAAAAFFFDGTNGSWVIRAMTESGAITARDGRWLAIPTQEALSVLPTRLHHNRNNRGRGGSSGGAVEAVEQKFGGLQFVYLRGQRRAFLVAEVRATSRKLKSGGVKRGFGKTKRGKTGRAGANVQTVVMFVLVPQVRRAASQALDLGRIADRYAAEFAEQVVAKWPDQAA